MIERDRLLRIRSRLMRAIRYERPADLRAAVVDVASDIESMLEGRPVADELAPVTLRRPDAGSALPRPPRVPSFRRAEMRDTEPAPEPEFVEEGPASPPVPTTRPSGGA